MKRILWGLVPTLLGFSLLGLGNPGRADATEAKPYRVVFDLTSRDSLAQRAVMRWIQEISASSPDAEMEVVMYGKGLELVMPDRSKMLPEVQDVAKNPKVSFRVCAIALKNNKVDKDQLVKEVQTVPDGIHELVMKQQAGWGYIKVAP